MTAQCIEGMSMTIALGPVVWGGPLGGCPNTVRLKAIRRSAVSRSSGEPKSTSRLLKKSLAAGL